MQLSGIEQKIRGFRIQIRQRSIQKQFNKVRHQYWLYNQQQYSQLQSQILYLIACCKFSQPNFHNRALYLQQLISTLQNNLSSNWNAYIVIAKQFVQLNILSYICQSQVQAEYICKLGQLLLLNKKYKEIANNLSWKEQIEENRNKLLEDCCVAMHARLAQELFQCIRIYLNKNQYEWQQKYQLANKINTMVKLMSQLIQSKSKKLIQNITAVQSTFQQSIYQFQCSQIFQLLLQYIKNQVQFILSNENISDYLNMISFILQAYTQFHQIKSAQSYENRENSQLYKISKQILQMLNIIFMNERFPNFIINYSKSLCNVRIMIKLLLKCQLFDNNWQSYIYNVLYYSISDDMHIQQYQKTQQNALIYEQLLDLSINLMSKICFEEQWVCYSVLKQFILLIFQQPTNVFKNSEINNSCKLKPMRKLCDVGENMLINVFTNLFINQYQHHCMYQYYEMIQIILADIRQSKLMNKWATNGKFRDNFQYLFLVLCNTKKYESKQYLIEIGQEFTRSSQIKKEVRKKFTFMKQLYNADKKYIYSNSMNVNGGRKNNASINQYKYQIFCQPNYQQSQSSEFDNSIDNDFY